MSHIKFLLGITILPMVLFLGCDQRITFEERLDMDKATIAEYLADNNLTGTTLTSGVFYAITEEGVGTETPTFFSTLEIEYVGTFLDGTEFDSTEGFPADPPLQVSRLITGWQEAIQFFTKGSSGIIIVPSSWAYGSQGTASGSIPPNTILRFDITLYDFQ